VTTKTSEELINTSNMIRESRRSSSSEIRYCFLILGLNYLGIKNFGANRKDHSR
jgi:hypothetical protein